MTNEQLTAIYNEANGIDGGKNPPITTQRIFSAMRFAQVKVLREAATTVLDRYFAHDAANYLDRMADDLEKQ